MHAHHRSHSHRAVDAEKVHVLDAPGSSDTVAETTVDKKQKDKRKGQRNSGTSRNGSGILSLADAHTHFASAPSLSSTTTTTNKGKQHATANLAYVLAPSIQLDEGLSASGTEINFWDEEDEETDSEAQDQLGDIDGRISRQRSVVAAVVASSSLFFAPSGSASDSSGASCLVPLKTGNEILLKEFSEASETFDDSQDEMDLLSLYNASSRPMSMEILSSGIKDALAIEPPISTATELEEPISQRPSQCPTPKARTASISTEMTSHTPAEDRTSITSGLSGSSPSSGVPRYLVKESWDASGRSSMEPSPNIKNPMRVRHSFMSTVSSASSAPSIPSKFACSSDKSIGPFWISLDMVHKLASEMDFGLFSKMDFRAVGSDSEFDEEDDYGLVTRGPGIDLSKQFVEPVFEQEDGVVSIKSGSLHSLVTYLWANIGGGTDQNQRLMVEFLQTYRYFATSEDVARLLALSYMEIDWSMDESDDAFIHSHSEFLENLSVGVCSGTNKDWSGILQLRILNVFKKWIDLHPDDFTANKELLEFTTLFFEKMVEKDEKRAMHGSSIVGNLRDKVRECELNKYLAIPALPSLTCSRGHKSAPNLSAKSRTQSEGPPPTITSASSEHVVGPILKPSSWNLRRKFSFRGSSSKSTDTLASVDTEKVAAPSSPFNLNIFHSRTASAQPSLQQTQEHGTMSITAALAAISPPTRRLSELDPTSVAKQLTLLEHNHFRKIKIDEFFMQSWSKKKDGGVGVNAASKSRLVTFINWFNRVAYGIATEVVKLTVLKERVVMLKRLIFVAEICVKWNNFNTAFEIVAGLNLGPVSRLAKTWKALPAKYMDAWNKLNRIVSSESSYRTYRQLIAQIKEQGASIPVLPYLGVNLSDLTFTEDGNPTYVTNDECSSPGELIKIINFSKFKMISKLLSAILKFQSGQYDFEYDEHVQRWLRTEWEAASSKELYEMSLLCEPRIVST
ncbi:hypothetical protein HDU78_003363 [Chytriomyces hyalinus]|nr:hypothetical protein HDU78_003363 [Chytriomyces hyalinus]